MRVNVQDAAARMAVTVIVMAIIAGFSMQLQQSVKEIRCAREGYPIARRISLTQVACFTVENGATVTKN